MTDSTAAPMRINLNNMKCVYYGRGGAGDVVTVSMAAPHTESGGRACQTTIGLRANVVVGAWTCLWADYPIGTTRGTPAHPQHPPKGLTIKPPTGHIGKPFRVVDDYRNMCRRGRDNEPGESLRATLPH
jgi:hypothetical protein